MLVPFQALDFEPVLHSNKASSYASTLANLSI